MKFLAFYYFYGISFELGEHFLNDFVDFIEDFSNIGKKKKLNSLGRHSVSRFISNPRISRYCLTTWEAPIHHSLDIEIFWKYRHIDIYTFDDAAGYIKKEFVYTISLNTSASVSPKMIYDQYLKDYVLKFWTCLSVINLNMMGALISQDRWNAQGDNSVLNNPLQESFVSEKLNNFTLITPCIVFVS